MSRPDAADENAPDIQDEQEYRLNFAGLALEGEVLRRTVNDDVVADIELSDIREISVFISHIRFALMIVLAIFLWGYDVFAGRGDDAAWIRAVKVGSVIWLLMFLFILKSSSGLVILGVLSISSFGIVIFRSRNFMLRYFLSILSS